MATKELVTTIILRNDISTNWASAQPTPSKGEVCLETDTNKYKIGNGVSQWADLPYFNHITDSQRTGLDTLIDMLNDDEFGKVDDVQVNGSSVISNKIANIVVATVKFGDTTQSVADLDLTQDEVTLHKVARTGLYTDLIGSFSVVDNLESSSTTDALSAKQGSVLANMVQNVSFAESYPTISSMVTALNSASNTELKVGMNLFIQALNVPDFWVYSVESTSVSYTYTTDQAFIDAINTSGSVQVGYYKVSMLETEKVDLSDYYTKAETDNLLSNKITKNPDGTYAGYVNLTDSAGYTGIGARMFSANSGSSVYVRELRFSKDDFAVENVSTETSNMVNRITLDETVLRSSDTFIINGGTSGV